MKILVVHSYYQQRGGEDGVFIAERDLLQRIGNDVHTFEAFNDEATALNYFTLVKKSIWNEDIAIQIEEIVKARGIEVVHFHNTFPLISAAAYSAARRAGAAVVQTVHNYRMLCVNGTLLRNDRPCELCVGKIQISGVVHGCYRDSSLASSVVATMNTFHQLRGTFRNDVDLYIAPTNFVRDKLIKGGLFPSRIVVKPHFVNSQQVTKTEKGDAAIYVGRLSKEKGVDTLIAAWKKLNGRLPLKIIGDGPLSDAVALATKEISGVSWLGRLPPDEVRRHVAEARMLVNPSICYETFGLTIVEAFAATTPVVVSGHGAFAEIVLDGITGLHFSPSDSSDLAEKVLFLCDHPTFSAEISNNGRAEYEQKYTPEQNFSLLMAHYQEAILNRSREKMVAR
tara:strand:- start:7198 stop:8385 length:1188 start_codon:yes stop_codon:yes gene_type:complete